eukprot:gene6202-8540_t
MATYEKLRTDDPGDIDIEVTNSTIELFSQPIENVLNNSVDNVTNNAVVTRNDTFVLSKPPPNYRDKYFAICFLVHFLLLSVLFIAERNSIAERLITNHSNNASEMMFIIITLLGGVFGVVYIVIISFSNIRDNVLIGSLLSSIVLKICIGNVLLIMRSVVSFIGVFILISAIADSFRYRNCRDNVAFTSALLMMIGNVTNQYGYGFAVVVSFIVIIQTMLLVVWSAFFISLISIASKGFVLVVVGLMLLSLFWITQVFHALMAFVVGGCILWIFVKQEKEALNPTKRLLLYLQCGMTTSFGSLCKGALFVPPCHLILLLSHWVHGRTNNNTCNVKGLVSYIISPLVETAKKNNKLTFSLMATYGRTFSKSAEDHITSNPETLDICVDDNTAFVLQSASVSIAAIISIIFCFFANRNRGDLWSVYFFLSFYLGYCGLSLTLHAYSSAVDALVVSSALNPILFARNDQIVFLRFLRTSELALR